MKLKCAICGHVEGQEHFGDEVAETVLVQEREYWVGLVVVSCTDCFARVMAFRYALPIYHEYVTQHEIGEMIRAIGLPPPPVVGVGNWEEVRAKLTAKIMESNQRIFDASLKVRKAMLERIKTMRAGLQQETETEAE